MCCFLEDDQLVDITHYLVNLGRQEVTTLGLVLGLYFNTMRNLQDDFLKVVITSWLNKADNVEKKGVPSWRALVRGLRDKQVRQNGIAANIARDHHTRGMCCLTAVCSVYSSRPISFYVFQTVELFCVIRFLWIASDVVRGLLSNGEN